MLRACRRYTEQLIRFARTIAEWRIGKRSNAGYRIRFVSFCDAINAKGEPEMLGAWRVNHPSIVDARVTSAGEVDDSLKGWRWLSDGWTGGEGKSWRNGNPALRHHPAAFAGVETSGSNQVRTRGAPRLICTVGAVIDTSHDSIPASGRYYILRF